jgi:transcriptional regulator with GAF, ATPase, and Fis domain
MSEVDTKTTVKINGNGGRDQAQSWNAGRELGSAASYLAPSPESSLRSFRDEAEIHAISSALKQTGWNRKRAAQLLSISYRGLLYKIRRHKITPNGNGTLKPAPSTGNVQS